MEKPILKNEIEAKITTVAKVEDNIQEAKEYALQLKEYYSKLVFNDKQLSEAKEERASINKIVKKIADYRKNIIAEFKKPIEVFENTAKETEKILKETADFVDIQVKSFEDKEKEEKRQNVEEIFNKISENEEINELIKLNMIFDERYLNKTYSLEKVEKDLTEKLDKINQELKAIKELNSEYELSLINMYLKDFDLSKVIIENNRLKELKKTTEKVEEAKEKVVNNKIETMLKKEVEEDISDPILTYTLEITAPLSKQKALKEFLDLNKMKYKKIEKQDNTKV